MRTISYTYDVVTEESAAYGDTADNGFCDEYGNQFSLLCPAIAADIDGSPDDYWKPVEPGDVAAAIRFAIDHGCTEDNGDGSFYGVDDDVDVRTGDATRYAVHFNGPISPASLDRISRAIRRV